MTGRVQTVIKNRFFLMSLRVIIGGIFVFSGVLKLIEGPQEFAVVIKDYQVLPPFLLLPLATILPWLELFSGAFLIIGYLPRLALATVLGMLLVFVLAIGSTIVRGIPLEDCGCFGGIIKETPSMVISRDIVLMFLAIPLVLDYYFGPSAGDGRDGEPTAQPEA